MASDDESTQPIDIEALRSSLPSSGTSPRPKKALSDDTFSTDEHTAIAIAPPVVDTQADLGVEEPVPSAPFPAFEKHSAEEDRSFDEPWPSGALPDAPADGPFGVAPLSSVTRIDAAPMTPLATEDELAIVTLKPTSSIAHGEITVSMPGTVPAHELVQALVAVMGARSERSADPDVQAEDTHAGLDTLANSTVTASSRGADSDEPLTATGFGFPAGWADVEVTSVSPGRSASSTHSPAPSTPSSRDDGIVSSNASALPLVVHKKHDAQPTADRSDDVHPADEEDQTRMGRLDDEEVRAIFATAEHGEETVIVRSPRPSQHGAPRVRGAEMSASSIAETPRMASEIPQEIEPEELEPQEIEPEPDDLGDEPETGQRFDLASASAPDSNIIEVDSMELESEPDLTDDDAEHDLASTAEGEARSAADSESAPAESEPFPSAQDVSLDSLDGRDLETSLRDPRAEAAHDEERLEDPGAARAIESFDELPRFSLASMDDIVLSAHEEDVQLVSGSGVSIVSDFGEPADLAPPRSMADIETQAQPKKQRPPPQAQAPQRSNAPPPLPAFNPPAPVRVSPPAYEVDTDDDEDQLLREGSFRALLDLYRFRLADADSPSAKALILHKIASVYEHKLGEQEAAFNALVEAFDLRASDDEIVASLDRVARAEGRVGELADRARKNLHTADAEQRVILLGHLVHWYERVLNRPSDMAQYAAELERLDKSHPVTLRRQALIAASNGDFKSQRDLLVRALDRTGRREEKVALYIALAGAYAGTPDAAKHYESAVANDASSVVALQGLERLGREAGKHGQVEWTLERQVEVALTTAERVDALLKLADLYETKYLKRERAAEILERIVEIEPAHPQALKALERCYHALRDWPRLAQIIRARADNSYDKKEKAALLELAAEVFESKLGDAESAIEVHRDLLIVDPKHRRALGDLARLYEKLGDWGNLSIYKARVAELAPSKRQASQLLVQLGDFLSAPDRDAVSARMQYERAVVVDPTNAAAWEALQRVAAAAGDARRVSECLEQRAKHVDGPRQRAAIFVELANVHLGNGAERAAREAFEQAIIADPTNEIAAATMLDAYTREEKWVQAAPLCELLVNVAKRDNNPRMVFTRLRLATRIGAALGDPDRAMTSALAALEIDFDDQGAQADLVAVCSQCREQPRVVARAKSVLTRIANGTTVLPAPVLVSLAQLQRDAGEVDAAAQTLEQALAADPDHVGVQKELADVYLAQGDFPRCCKLKVDMARNATTADLRFQLLCDAGEIWARRADELDKAATVFEEARQIKPLDHWLLHTLLWLYGERHRWDDLSNVLESIAQIQESPEKKAKSFFAMAQVVLEKVGDPVRAAELFNQVLDIDKRRLDAFELLVRALTEAKDWEALEVSYRKMLARIKDDPEPNEHLQFMLFQQLGLIYRDRLEDAERAYEALEAAARYRPDDTNVRKIVTELLVVTDNLDNAVARTREMIERDPHDAELYSELYDLFLRQHYFDKAWCAVNVLVQMREPSAEQRRFHADYAPMPLAEIPGQIVEQAWRSHVLHRDLDPTLTTLFARMTPAVARMRYAQLRPEQQAYATGRPFTNQHSRIYEQIRITFANAAEILHMAPPELLLGDPGSLIPFAPALAPFGAVHVSAPAVEARADALIYVIGKRLAEQRPELLARAFFPAVSDLTALLAAAVRVSRQEGAKDAAGAALDASLNAVLMPQERDGIRAVVTQAAMVGGLVDVKRWSQAADLSSMRAGLLLCGDVGPARKTILAEPQSNADLPPREKIAELYMFATSDLYSDLRGAIGVAVQD